VRRGASRASAAPSPPVETRCTPGFRRWRGAVSLESRAVLLLGVVLGAGGCPERGGAETWRASRQAVVNGTLDAGDPAVVALVARRTRCQGEAPTLLCTGTLIAPRVVLTAAHCLNVFGPEGPYEVFFGASVNGDGRFAAVTTAVRHPGYDPTTHEHDLALLRLEEAAPFPPATLPSGNDAGALGTGQTLRVVGFGDTHDVQAPSGQKRQGTMTASTVTPTGVRSVPGPGMSCVGDSGGPVFASVQGTEALYAVTASGDFGCTDFALNVRVDAALDDFIRPFLDATAQSPSDPGAQVDPAALCTRPCYVASDCPTGMLCVTRESAVGRCVMQGLGEGAYAEVCAQDGQCASGTCARLRSDGEDACRCFTPCSGAPGDVGHGGCAASGGATGGAFLASAALALFARRRRATRTR